MAWRSHSERQSRVSFHPVHRSRSLLPPGHTYHFKHHLSQNLSCVWFMWARGPQEGKTLRIGSWTTSAPLTATHLQVNSVGTRPYETVRNHCSENSTWHTCFEQRVLKWQQDVDQGCAVKWNPLRGTKTPIPFVQYYYAYLILTGNPTAMAAKKGKKKKNDLVRVCWLSCTLRRISDAKQDRILQPPSIMQGNKNWPPPIRHTSRELQDRWQLCSKNHSLIFFFF